MTNNHNNSHPLTATAELVCLRISSQLSNDDNNLLKTDPHQFINAKYGLNLEGEVNLQIVENNNNTIHVSLPYYDALNGNSNPHSTSEDELENVSGGELMTQYSQNASRSQLDEFLYQKYGYVRPSTPPPAYVPSVIQPRTQTSAPASPQPQGK